MGSVQYAIKFSLRRPRLWLGVVMGIMLGLALINGAFMTADYLGFATISRELEKVKVDISVNIYNVRSSFNYEHYQEAIENIENVILAEPTCYMHIIGNITSESKSTSNIKGINTVFVFTISDSPKLEGFSVLEGTFNTSASKVALGYGLANMLDVDVGDNITVSLLVGTNTGLSMINVTFTVSAIVSFTGKFLDAILYQESPMFGFFMEPSEEYSRNPNFAIVLTIDVLLTEFLDRINQLFDGELIGGYVSSEYLVFVDREKVVNPWNLEESIRKLSEIETRIQYVIQGASEDSYVVNHLRWRLTYLSYMTAALKSQLAMQLLPAIFLGLLLAVIANWVSVNERRREVGLLKVKGARDSQIFSMLNIEAITAGLAGGLTGSVLGYFSATLFIPCIMPDLARSINPAWFLGNLVIWYVIGGLIAGMILGILSVVVPARKVSKLEVSKALMEYLEEIEAEEKLSKWTWIFLIFGSYGLVEVGLGFPVMAAMLRAIMAGFFVLIFFFLIFIFIELAAIAVGPFFFAYAASKVISYFSGKLSKVFTAIVTPISGSLNYVAVRNFVRKKTRVARVIFLIALTLTFGVYYAISSATNETRMIINTQLRVGADINIDLTWNEMTYDDAIRFVDNISRIDGILGVCKVASIPVLYARIGDYYTVIYGIDAEYFDVAFIKQEYLEDITITEAKQVISDSSDVILSINTKRYYGYKVGSDFYLYWETGENITRTRVAGFIKFAPGFMYTVFDLQRRYECMAFISIENAIREILQNDSSIVSISKFLIKVDYSYNVSAIVARISEVIEDMGYSAIISTYKETLRELKQYGFTSIVAFFTNIEFTFTLIIAFTGMALIMIMAILERRREIALLMAKGATRGSILGMIVGEALLITLLSFGLGLLVALAYSYGFLVGMMNFGVFMQEVYELPPGYSMTIPVSLILTLIGAFVAFLLSALIPATIVSRRNLADQLRIRH